MRPVTRHPARPRTILALVCAAQFMVILDLAIVNVALPSIQADLHVSAPSSLQWVVIAYGLTLGGFLLLGGRLADLFGRREVLATGLAVFSLAYRSPAGWPARWAAHRRSPRRRGSAARSRCRPPSPSSPARSLRGGTEPGARRVRCRRRQSRRRSA